MSVVPVVRQVKQNPLEAAVQVLQGDTQAVQEKLVVKVEDGQAL